MREPRGGAMARRVCVVAILAATTAAAGVTAGGASAGPVGPKSGAVKPFFDSRATPRIAAARPGGATRFARPSATTSQARSAMRSSLGRQAVMAIDPLTATPRQLMRLNGALSAPAAGARATIAMGYVRDHQAELGLGSADLDDFVLADSQSSGRGLTVMRWQQRYRGIPAFDNDLRVAVDRAGRVMSVGGSPVHGLSVPSIVPAVGAADALRRLATNVGAHADTTVASASTTARRPTRFADGSVARLVLFGAADGARLAWHVMFRAARTADYDAVVDAASGAILYRQNLVKFAANATVYPNFPGAEAIDPAGAPDDPNEPRTVDLEALGYLPANATTLNGRFAHTYVDANGSLTLDSGEEVPNSAGTDFDYPFVDFPNPSPRCELTALARTPTTSTTPS